MLSDWTLPPYKQGCREVAGAVAGSIAPSRRFDDEEGF